MMGERWPRLLHHHPRGLTLSPQLSSLSETNERTEVFFLQHRITGRQADGYKEHFSTLCQNQTKWTSFSIRIVWNKRIHFSCQHWSSFSATLSSTQTRQHLLHDGSTLCWVLRGLPSRSLLTYPRLISHSYLYLISVSNVSLVFPSFHSWQKWRPEDVYVNVFGVYYLS